MPLSQRWLSTGLALLCFVAIGSLTKTVHAQATDEKPSAKTLEMIQRFRSIEWKTGPAIGNIGALATIEIPDGYQFTEAKGAQTLLEVYGNPPDPSVLAAMLPIDDANDWTLIFEFDDIGYVKDDDQEALDPDALMASFQDGIEPGNAYRRSRGVEELSAINWAEKPFYDSETNNLTWALRLSFPSGNAINYDIRLLGRRGVMKATLIGSPETYAQAVPTVKQLLADYQFTDGNTYAEWTTGDKVAGYGLAGLVAGGATVAAMKTGLLAKLGLMLAKGGKALIAGICVLGAGLFSIIKRFFGGSSDPEPKF